MTPLERRQAEDAERERRIRHDLSQIALEMVAAHFGQAEWQRFRNQRPRDYLRAKIEVVSPPPNFRLEIDQSREVDGFAFKFTWGGAAAYRRPVKSAVAAEFSGAIETERVTVEFVPERAPMRFVLHSPGDCLAREPDEFLGMIIQDAQRRITGDTGVETRFAIRSDRAAYRYAHPETETQ